MLPATASASLAPTWLQLVTGARIPLASALAPQLQQAYAASAWLLSGSSLIESAAGDFYEMFGGLGSDGVSLVVKPANLLAGLGSASAQLKLEYATGQASLITLRVQPPVLQGARRSRCCSCMQGPPVCCCVCMLLMRTYLLLSVLLLQDGSRLLSL